MAKTKSVPPGTTDLRITALVTLLAENATIVISGARIAREIGVSRSTVWRWVQRLRELGVRAKGHPRTGYFLEKVPDLLTPDMLKRRLKGSVFGKHIHHLWRIDWRNPDGNARRAIASTIRNRRHRSQRQSGEVSRRVVGDRHFPSRTNGPRSIADGVAGAVAARIRERLQSFPT